MVKSGSRILEELEWAVEDLQAQLDDLRAKIESFRQAEAKSAAPSSPEVPGQQVETAVDSEAEIETAALPGTEVETAADAGELGTFSNAEDAIEIDIPENEEFPFDAGEPAAAEPEDDLPPFEPEAEIAAETEITADPAEPGIAEDDFVPAETAVVEPEHTDTDEPAPVAEPSVTVPDTEPESETNAAGPAPADTAETSVVEPETESPAAPETTTPERPVYPWSKDLPGLPVKNIMSGISLNDRVLFINTLFEEDPILFQANINVLNSMDSLAQAEDYLLENFPSWNTDSEVVYRFMMAVRRKLC